MSTLTMTPVSDLQVGDVLLMPMTSRTPAHPVVVQRLQPLRITGRTRVWVRSQYQQESLYSAWNFGNFAPSDQVNVLSVTP